MHNDAASEEGYEVDCILVYRRKLPPSFPINFTATVWLLLTNESSCSNHFSFDQIRLHNASLTAPQTHGQIVRAAASTRLVSELSRPAMATKAESFPRLFDAVKAKFPSSPGPDRWYLVAVKTLPFLAPASVLQAP